MEVRLLKFSIETMLDRTLRFPDDACVLPFLSARRRNIDISQGWCYRTTVAKESFW